MVPFAPRCIERRVFHVVWSAVWRLRVADFHASPFLKFPICPLPIVPLSPRGGSPSLDGVPNWKADGGAGGSIFWVPPWIPMVDSSGPVDIEMSSTFCPSPPGKRPNRPVSLSIPNPAAVVSRGPRSETCSRTPLLVVVETLLFVGDRRHYRWNLITFVACIDRF